ncbi:TPA: hypothetical protein ACHUVK_002718 [Shigella sonnei]
MSGVVTDGIQHGAEMIMNRVTGRKVLLTGTCWYELTGLWFLLSAQGYDVYRVPLGYPCASDCWDLVIVALSSEPVAGWGRHLSSICELRARLSGRMLVLAPEKLKSLKILMNICPVYGGCESLFQLMDYVRMSLTTEADKESRFILTDGQRRALKRLAEKGRSRPLNLKRSERKLYWHYARLAENVGVRDFSMLLMTGLDKEICRMEDRAHAT